MIWVVTGCATLLAIAGVLTLIRVERGPSMLDRMVAADILLTVIIGAVALEAAWHRRMESVPVLAALALVGFVGSVTVARFAAADPRKAAPRQERVVVQLDAELLADSDPDDDAPPDVPTPSVTQDEIPGVDSPGVDRLGRPLRNGGEGV